jgi:uncharacterized SAM-binding protein YcdF (DUF218 family)
LLAIQESFGLIGGKKVTPLLAKRIDRAIQFYREQSEKTLSPPQLLMSGGQGPDEKIPESQAMRVWPIMAWLFYHRLIQHLKQSQNPDYILVYWVDKSEKTLSPPQLLMSGGQGPDEKIPESQAMREYALEQGIPDEDIIMAVKLNCTINPFGQ